MKKSAILIKIFILIAPFSLAAAEHHFHVNFSYQEGLIGSQIRSCCQDGYGRLWVGTSNGVYYYTGTNFEALDSYDYIQSCTKITFAVACDAEGRVWVAAGSGAGYYDTQSGVFTPVPGFNTEPARDLDTGPDGTVWLTSSSGIWKYDASSAEVIPVLAREGFRPMISCFSGNGDNLYIVSSDGGVMRYTPSSGRAESVYRPERSGSEANCLTVIADDRVLVSTTSGLLLELDGLSGRMRTVLDLKGLASSQNVTSLMILQDEFWIGTSSGLVIYDTRNQTIENQTGNVEGASSSLSGQTIRGMFTDRDGNVWVGTANGGLRGWMSYGGNFYRFVSEKTDNSIAGTSIRAICEDGDGFIWIGTEEGLLSRLDPRTQEFTDFSSKTGIRYGTVITSLRYHDRSLWIATYGEGLFEFDPAAGRLLRKCHCETERFFALTDDHRGHILAGTDIGIFSLNPKTGGLALMQSDLGSPVHSLVEDAMGRIWIGTYGQGVEYWEPGTPFHNEWTQSGNRDSNKASYINHLLMDSRGRLWICSEGGGLIRISFTGSGSPYDVRTLDRSSGFPSNDIKGIVESGDGKLWVSTSDGLVELDPSSLAVRNIYMQTDSLIGKFFDAGSCFLSEAGIVYMGTNKGLLAFDPAGMESAFQHTPVFINGIVTGMSGNMVRRTQPGRSAINTESLQVRQKDTPVITLTYSPVRYDSPNRDLFDCELRRRGFTSAITTENNTAVYVGLKPGRYTFSVVEHGDPDPADKDSVRILIKAPWYRSTVAKLVYAALAVLLLAWLARRWRSEQERVAKLKEAQNKMQTLHNQMNFITNVTHEIRTPVTMMTILMDRLSGHGDKDSSDDFKSLKSNMNHLLELCDQMLDYRKVENEQVRLNLQEEDLVDLVKAAATTFRPTAEARGMQFSLGIPDSPVTVACDRGAVEGILSNLLSNAIKYGQSRILMSLGAEGTDAVVRVDSDGELIPKDESEKIFNAFYQRKQGAGTGTGLGLTYSRALANMHEGRLFLDSSREDMNSFVFTLPLKRSGDPQTAAQESSPVEEEALQLTDGKPLILVVEDNVELRGLVVGELSKSYLTAEAGNGKEALQVIGRENVDIVVSDIMMPEMDGCELCNAIKTDVRTSHILVILLTAAIGVDNHIRSLKAGADSYIEKPFRTELLKETIHNLLRNREIRNEQFALSPLSHFNCASISSVEQEFMDSLHNFILEHISDTEMTTGRLAEAMNTTAKTLSHKIKANTGLSVNEYVRTCRLKKAAELLAKHKYRVNEVGYLVGYSTPSYFTKHFTAQFGMKPSEFLKSL